MEKRYFDEIKLRAIKAAMNVNDCAEQKAVNRNHTNYGFLSAWLQVIIDMGHKTTGPVWEDENGCLRVPFIDIDGQKIIEFSKGK